MAPPLKGPRRTIIVVAAISAMVQAASILDAGLWVQPDSVGYVTLAQSVLEHRGFSHELFIARPPGYPLFLATILSLAGSASGVVVLVVQHAMVVAVGVLTGLIAWELTGRRSVVVAAGILAGSSWSLSAYASTVLTETPYTLAVMTGAYLLVVHLRTGSLRTLGIASLILGISSLIRLIGLPLMAVCLGFGLHRTVRRWRSANKDGGAVGGVGFAIRLAMPVLAAVLPGTAVAGLWSLHGRFVHGVNGAASYSGQSLYHRVLYGDGLVEPTSPELEEIKRSVDVVNRNRPAADQFNYRRYEEAFLAYRQVHGSTYQETSAVLGGAARATARAHKWAMARGSLVNAARILLVPDPIYLFRPTAEMPERGTSGGEVPCRSIVPLFRDFHTRMYANDNEQLVGTELPSGPLTPMWTALAHWYHRSIVKAEPIPFLPGDNLYEHWVFFCCLGAVLTLCSARGAAWVALAGIVAFQVLPCGFIPGPTPRLAVPIRPFVDLWGVWLLLATPGFLKACVWDRRPTAGRAE